MSKQNIITTSSCSYRERIDYIATAILYCWYLWISKTGNAMEIRISYIIRLLVAIFLPKRFLYRLYRNQDNIQEANYLLYKNLECGQYISIAKRMVYQTFGGYLAFLLFFVACIICSFIGWDLVLNWKDGMIYFGILFTVVVLITIGLCILTKIFEDPRDYIFHFEEFKKKDEEWHKRWKRYTILLFVGSILSVVLIWGFGLLCIAIQQNLL